MLARWLFLAAYTSSGVAGLIYQVAWTRRLTLYLGHTTAAASTVVAAFMGGLALGAGLGGLLTSRLNARQALYAYAALEAVVVAAALTIPLELAGSVPILSWAYRDGDPGILFPSVRLVACLTIVIVPALALGATFPLAVRGFPGRSVHAGRDGGQLYAANTLGAAVGALLAGFVLIPALGVSGTGRVGVAASTLAIALVILLARRAPEEWPAERQSATVQPPTPATRARTRAASASRSRATPEPKAWLAAAVLGLTGFATFLYEIAWTRVLSLTLGPTTYAFAATAASVITGTALGSAAGAWIAGRVRQPAVWLAITLGATALATGWTTSFVGQDLPRLVARELSRSPSVTDQLLMRHATLVVSLLLPTAIGLGIAFPLALELIGTKGDFARRLGLVYAVNTAGAVAGSLLAGFVAIPVFGLQHTLQFVGLMLTAAAGVVLGGGSLTVRERIAGALPAAAAIVLTLASPSWDRELLASGLYLYAPRVPQGVDLETSLKAGRLLYYRDGAASTVSVKQLAGEISLAIDGKVDASSGGDMPTQKALAHLPLLLHPNPRNVLVIGLGSGVTAAAALVQPVTSLDVIEVSPEVVEASRYFGAENRNVLDDPRTHLVIGDGRSHLLLSDRNYDVIISEPSNPWMAGVASLFTREFFTAARDRLSPDGIICQWAHTYAISGDDLRSIAATFLTVFPHGTIWLIGRSDVLLVASNAPLDQAIGGLSRAWTRPGVAADLREVSAMGPFAFLSSFAGGPAELRRYADAAPVQTDDRMALEFSGPRALYRREDRDNVAALLALRGADGAPTAIRHALERAGGPDWRDRGAMMLRADDFASAYDDYLKAVALDPLDRATLDGLIRTAVGTGREQQAVALLRSAMASRPEASTIRLALSRLLAATGAYDEAVSVANNDAAGRGGEAAALEQLASIFSDTGDGPRLAATAARLRQIQPRAALTEHYAAAAAFLAGHFEEAAELAGRAIALDPASASAHNLQGASYASLGRPQDARRAFDAALAANRRDDATYVNLGLLELNAGDRAGAARYFAEALSINPRSEGARRGLAQAQTP